MSEHTYDVSSNGYLLSYPKQWIAPVCLGGITLTLFLAHQGELLTLLFPVLAILLGGWLYLKYPAHYVGYVWWMWFLSAEVRRLADFAKGSYTATSLIQVAPLVVTMISGVGLMRYHRILGAARGLPVLMILVGLAYAFAIGVISSGPWAALYDLANWLYPILLGWHILVHAREYPLYRQVILNTFIQGMLVMGLYGIVQFFMLPPWDAMWMLGAQMGSQGEAVAFGVRVFSTMNSCGPFAFAMMGALAFVPAATTRGRGVAATVGLIAFGLSLVRSTWGGWIIALMIQLAQSSNRARVRIIVGMAMLIGLCMPIFIWGPVADRLSARIQTVANLDEDQSYAARNAFYASFANTAFTNIAGVGLGATGISTKLSTGGSELGKYGNFDSGLMNIPFVLGWPGTLLYLTGVSWLLARAVRASFALVGDKFAAACVALACSVFSMLVFANSLTGAGGLLFATSVFSVLSAAHWKKMQHSEECVLIRSAK